MIKPLKKLLLIFYIISTNTLFCQSVMYNASNEIIANPERGLQKYSITSDDYAINEGENNLPVSTLEDLKTGADKITVVYRYFLLDTFLNTDINTTYLNNIQTDFDNVRSAGLKIIVRFSYSNEQSTTAQQASKAQILAHITQLSEVLNVNKDVILSLQAGFIGTWGEWYYTNSTEFGTDGTISETQWANRKEIVDAMLTAAPKEIPVQVRYTAIKTNMYGDTFLNETTAYQNTPNARIGFYNDAFLNDYGDQGTYAVSSQCTNPVGTLDYNYLSNETKYLPMTGETNGLNSCDNGDRTTSENAKNELNLTNWTTINRDYYIPFWDQVISAGDYNEILKNLGYRFVLNSSTVSVNSNGFDLSLQITNEGYARPFKERNVYLIAKNRDTEEIIKLPIDTDIRTWEATASISQSFNLESTGIFDLYIWIPDINESLANNSDYSIQFANTDIWDETTGYNNLLQTVTFNNTLGNDDVQDDSFSIYPNPFTDKITLKLKKLKPSELKVYDVNGKLIKEFSVFNNDEINLSELSKGIYFICIDNDKSTTEKLIKK